MQPQIVSVTNPYIDGSGAWESYGIGGIILGGLLAIFGIILQVLEIVRIYAGLYNYGLKNVDLTHNNQYSIVSISNGYFLYAEPWHFWPWTYAGNAIGLIVMIAGLTGIASGLRKSYTTVYSFFALSLLSTLLPAFLIVYYAILLGGYYKNYISTQTPTAEIWNPGNRPHSGDISYGTAGANLAISVLTIVIAFISTLYAGISGKICTRKKEYADYYGNEKINTYPYANPAFLPPGINT